MLVFRLFRVGKNNQPSFKILVTDKRNSSKGGRFVEQIGFYNPVTKEKVLNKERVHYWLKQGVQPSPTLYNLFVKDGILEGKKIPLHKKSKKPAEPASAEAKPQVKEQNPAQNPADKPVEAPAPKAEEIKKEEPVKTEAKAIEAEPQSTEAPKTE